MWLRECAGNLANMYYGERRLRKEARQQKRLNREYRRALQVCATLCGNCGRALRVTPLELRDELVTTRPSAVAEEVTASATGLFTCPCGALGWLRGAHVIAPRGPSPLPTTAQRRFLEALANGEQTSVALSKEWDFDDPATTGELILAREEGWVAASLAGIGGLFARPATIYRLTDRGRDVLRRH